jgi:hypothetical protein
MHLSSRAILAERERPAPNLVCQPHQYREAGRIAIAPLAGVILPILLQCKNAALYTPRFQYCHKASPFAAISSPLPPACRAGAS